MNGKMRVRHLSEVANLLAVAVALEVFSMVFLPEFRLGGGITLASCAPILLVSYRRGYGWGILSGVVFGLAKLALNFGFIRSICDPAVLGADYALKTGLSVLLDYFLAYAAMGLGGIFRQKNLHRRTKFILGALVALAVRFAAHLVSGYVVYSSLAADFFENSGISMITPGLVAGVSEGMLPLAFTLIYNSLYMIPEILITLFAVWMLSGNRKVVTRAS